MVIDNIQKEQISKSVKQFFFHKLFFLQFLDTLYDFGLVWRVFVLYFAQSIIEHVWDVYDN